MERIGMPAALFGMCLACAWWFGKQKNTCWTTGFLVSWSVFLVLVQRVASARQFGSA